MRRFAILPVFALGAALFVTQLAAQPLVSRASSDHHADRDIEIDRQNLKKIYDAIQAYRQARGDLPNWLSDLVPQFLSDTNALMCPVELRTGRSQLWEYGDPKIHSSYIYEFSQIKAGGIRDQEIPLTMKEWKSLQMDEYGPVIPLLRCHLHERVASMSYSGEFYQTGLFWETDTNTFALMERLGPGPGARYGQKLRVTARDAETGAAISGAQVIATNRQSEFGHLPPRRMTTDADGVCEVNLGGKQPRRAKLEIWKPGFATASTEWTDGEAFPTEWIAQLEKAVQIGGVVTDAKGNPISGVTVVVNGLSRDAVGQVIPFQYDLTSTGPDGKWASGKVPKRFEELSFVFSHAEFMPAEYDLATPDYDGPQTVSREDLLAGNARSALEPGLAVRGVVKDSEGAAAAGVEVQLTINPAENPVTLATKTDQQGAFKLVATVLGDAILVLEAADLAPKAHTLYLAPDLAPISLTMDKGRQVHGQVLGDDRQPLPDVEISVAGWEGRRPLSWRAYTDSEGRFSWETAPAGRLHFGIRKAGYLARYEAPPQSGHQTWSVQLERPFRLAGQVLDAASGEPIKKYTLRRGLAYSEAEAYRWDEQVSHPGDGSYDTGERDQGGSRMVRYAVWADGYLPSVSPAFEQTGVHQHDFRLEKGSGIGGVLLLPDGSPVEGATLFLTTRSQSVYMDKPGQFRSRISDIQSAVSDSAGRFQFQPELDAHSIFSAHEKGFAEISAEKAMETGKVRLEPWAVVRGKVSFGNPGPHLSVSLHNMNYRYPAGAVFPRLGLYLNVIPDDDGSFIFDKVPPGHRKLHVQYKFHDGPGVIPLSHGGFLDLAPGEIREINFGDKGRSLTGKVRAAGERASEVDWLRDLHKMTSVVEGAPEPQLPSSPRSSNPESIRAYQEFARKQREFWGSPEGIVRQQKTTEYLLLFQEDGSFLVEGIPPGTYTLSIVPTHPTDESLAQRYGLMRGAPLGQLTKQIVVPEADPGCDESFDLGTIEMRLHTQPTSQP
jgi:hypothetical protein